MVVFVIYNQISLEFEFIFFASLSIITYATTIHITRSEKMSLQRF